MDSEEIKALVTTALLDIKGQELVCLDIRQQTDLADYMIVVSGGTGRQVKALTDNVRQSAKKQGLDIIGVEGEDSQEWVLIDLADVIVHIMLPKVREFYDLERLWSVTPTKPEESKG